MSWNVEFFNFSLRVGGVYQCAGLLSVADIAHELNVCFVCDPPDYDAAPWAPALLLRSPSTQNFIVLDQHNDDPFPTPTTEIHSYEYVLRLDCARLGDPHKMSGMQHLLVSICITANSIQMPASTDSQVW